MKRQNEGYEDWVLSVFIRFFVPFVLAGVLTSMVIQSGPVSVFLLLAVMLARSVLSPAFWANCGLVSVAWCEARQANR